jgi:hypothetical protein
VKGYCCDAQNKQLNYRLNGVWVFVAMMIIWWQSPIAVRESLLRDYWSSLICANIFGIGISAFFFIRGGQEKYERCVTVDQLSNLSKAKLASKLNSEMSIGSRFFLGHEWNPRMLGGLCDVKMMLYLVGAVGLGANILAATSVHAGGRAGSISTGMAVYLVCFFWFLVEYMMGEEGMQLGFECSTVPVK